MLLSTVQLRTHFTAAMVLLCVCFGPSASVALSQETATPESLITDLKSQEFRTRSAAAAALRKAGNSAIEPLRKALATATGEQKFRIQELLNELQQNTFSNLLNRLKKTPTVETAEQLPEWSRFAKIAGTDESSLKLYARLLSAETALFVSAKDKSRELPNLIQDRAAELVQSVRPSAGSTVDFPVDSYAALLLLVSDDSRRASGNTSTSVSTLLMHPSFAKALAGPDGKKLKRLAATYIMRKRIAVEKPINFARKHPVPEGPELARRTLKTALRGQNGKYAMMLLKEQGNASDIALLESLFQDKGVLVDAQRMGLRNVSFGYRAFNGDMALAVAIVMRNQDPREYGFGKGMAQTEEFSFVNETIGFSSDVERQQAHAKYERQFLNKSTAE